MIGEEDPKNTMSLLRHEALRTGVGWKSRTADASCRAKLRTSYSRKRTSEPLLDLLDSILASDIFSFALRALVIGGAKQTKCLQGPFFSK
jgi:hypothetical protein